MRIPKNAYQDAAGKWWYSAPGVKSNWAQVCRTGNCLTCKAPYVKTHANKDEYCSVECRRKPCVRCAELFLPNSSRQKYCSKRCKVGEWACEECGNLFMPTKKSKRRFCSNECFYENKVPTGSVRNHYGGYRIIKVPRDSLGMRVKGGRGRWMLEHRYVMQQKLGRPLEDYERAHHINGDRADNRPENLELWKRKSGGHPIGVRSSDYHCPGCRCFEH